MYLKCHNSVKEKKYRTRQGENIMQTSLQGAKTEDRNA